MKIRNILCALIVALPVLTFTSCLKDDDEVFGDSSSLRLQQNLNEVKSVLRSPEYGWVMDYYVGDGQMYGGYAVTVKFDSLTCTAASELTPREVSSYYKMTTDQGPVLTFDTYNEVLHALATPSSSNYEGYHADFEFIVLSATPELVVLQGKRVGNYAYLHPLTKPALEYLEGVSEMETEIYAPFADAKIGSDSVTAAFDFDARSVTFTSPTNSEFSETRAFTYTDNGLRLYSDVAVGSAKLSSFTYNAEGMSLTGADGIVMSGRMPDSYVEYADYAGTYWLYFVPTAGEDSVQVTLKPNEDGTSFTMSGLSEYFDVNVTYNRGTGSLAINTQQVGQVDGSIVWFNAANMKNGLYPAYPGCGMVTEWNGDKEHPVYTWVTNNDEMSSTDSFCLWLTDTAGNSLGQYMEWPIAGSYGMLPNVKRMVKIN